MTANPLRAAGDPRIRRGPGSIERRTMRDSDEGIHVTRTPDPARARRLILPMASASPHTRSRRLPAAHPAAWVLATVLVLGALTHAWHHLSDPSCDRAGAAHPCTLCVGLHSAAIVAVAVVATAHTRMLRDPIAVSVAVAPARATRTPFPTRAPPRG